ncbi:MAG: ABC transporter ATP-binding protein [Sporolactobacillus sp.]|jgi:ABC-2 type transport system ATP-binding protein|nr:ABC transporter ATP-binding protein [Sporolactobacillus sp.]
MMNVIEADGITKIYGTNMAVNNVSLKVKQGEIYGFLGLNGAGKSTFINILTGIIHPTSGSFALLGHSNLDKVKSRIGVLPEYSTFYDSLTAIGQLIYFSRLCGTAPTKTRCEHVLEQVGLLKAKDKKVKGFSFGMKKKLGVAQALIHNPELIFFDEPTAGMDIESSRQIEKLIVDLHRQGKTIFTTSHNLSEVEKICTRIAIMQNGFLVDEGTIDDLRTRHTKTLRLRIRHASVPGDRLAALFKQSGFSIKTKDNWSTLPIRSEADTPRIIRTFLDHNIDLYEVNVDKPSLEEIFLGME